MSPYAQGFCDGITFFILGIFIWAAVKFELESAKRNQDNE